MDTPLVTSPSNIHQFPPSPQSPSPPPPPLVLVQDDPHVVNEARKRFVKKSRFSRIFSRHSSSPQLRPKSSNISSENTPDLRAHDADNTPINLDNTALAGEGVYTDRYEWAVLYENQRGITVFSIPYYSSLSLLPSDPSPFTLPNASLKRSKQPPITLDSYPLPDGNWHWVSRCWMIDMRTDSGEVQHDGFEYNWMFRRHNWRAQIGSFNAGGWVRRRRWIRLMVRPAKPKKDDTDTFATLSTLASSRSSDKWRHRHSIASSFPPSVFTQRTDITDTWAKIDPDEVWMGDIATDWLRCRNLMKHFGRDGRKLELWKLWLGFHHPDYKQRFLEPEDKGKRREKQWTEDEGPLPSEISAADILSRDYVAIAPRDLVIALLRVHGQQLLHLFIFPESRVQFLKLLAQAELLPELNVGLGIGFGSTEVDFWSYASGLGDSIASLPKTAVLSKSSPNTSNSQQPRSATERCVQ